LDNYHESAAVFRVLSMPFMTIPPEDVMKLTQYAFRKARSFYEAMQELSLIPGVSAKGREKILFILSLIKKHGAMAPAKPVSEILVSFLEDSGYLKYLAENNDKSQIDLLNQFYRKIKNFEERVHDSILNNFMQEINLEMITERLNEFSPVKCREIINHYAKKWLKGEPC